MIDNIKAFLADLEAQVPEEFITDVDKVLAMVYDDILCNELVPNTPEQPINTNIEYTRNPVNRRVSYSADNTQDQLQTTPAQMPITRG